MSLFHNCFTSFNMHFHEIKTNLHANSKPNVFIFNYNTLVYPKIYILKDNQRLSITFSHSYSTYIQISYKIPTPVISHKNILYYFITFYLNQQGTELAKTFLFTVENFSSSIYKQLSDAKTAYQKRNALRDTIVIELLFATEMRISKLYSLDVKSVS